MFNNYELIRPITVSSSPNAHISDLTTESLDEIVRYIQSAPTHKQTIEKIRECVKKLSEIEKRLQVADDKELEEEKKKLVETKMICKKQLPYFSFSSFKNNYRLKENFLSTQFLMFDADHVPNLADLRKKVEADPEIFMAFTSPSGDGLKFAIRLERAITVTAEYYASYDAHKARYAARYGIELDKSTKDPSRATFLSYDPDIYVNPVCAQVPVIIPQNPLEPEEREIEKPAEAKKKNLKAALRGTTPGNRHGDLTSIAGHLIGKGIEEEIAIELMRGWNRLNEPPKEDQEIVATVRDLYGRYNKGNPDTFAGLCTNYWSLSSDYLEFGIKGGRFFMSSIGKEKYLTFAGAREKEEKEAAIGYLLQHKHISNIRLVRHISDCAAKETSYEVNVQAGEVTVRYSPIDARTQDNQFIESYLGSVFGEYKQFIKEYLAAYCYTNFRDLPTLVLKGARGSGKNTFAEMIYGIFPALSQTWEAKKGSFTPEAEMKLLLADETLCDSKEVYQLLKQYAGAKYAQVNKKFQIPYDVENNMNIIIMSNAAIPIYVAKGEKPTSEANNQFFVYEFKPFTGQIDPDLDQKLADRIGHYVRTELKTVFDGLDFTGNRYSIKVPITPEEKGLFEGNTTEEESNIESVIDAVVDKASVAHFNDGYRKLMETGWIPTEMIKDEATSLHVNLQSLIKQLQSEDYLVMAESRKQTVKGSGNRLRCQQMTEKFRREIQFYEAPSAPSTARRLL